MKESKSRGNQNAVTKGKLIDASGGSTLERVLSEAHPVVGSTASLVLLYLMESADADGTVSLSASELADRLGLAYITAISLLKRLRAKGWIERVSGGTPGRVSVHRINPRLLIPQTS